MEMVLRDLKSCSLDFKASDDAWYTVCLTLRGEMLILKFCEFSDIFDERYQATDFKDPKKLEDFIKRFRPICVQLQDHECTKVVQGTTVCASYIFENKDVKFYDAVVMRVNSKDHKFWKEEACTCTFELYWLNGPNVGTVTETSVAHICLLQPAHEEMDPALSAFLNMCKEKQNEVSPYTGCVPEDDVMACATLNNHNAIIHSKLRPRRHESLTQCTKEVKSCKPSVSAVWKSNDTSTNRWEMTGLGLAIAGESGTGLELAIVGEAGAGEDPRATPTFHFVLIENLEKDLSPLSMVDFVKKHLSITSQAQVFPSSSSEPYTRGIIVVDSQVKVKKLSEFLRNPAHMILSAKERPWVVAEKKSEFLHNPAHMTLMSRERPWVITEKKLRGGAVGKTVGHVSLSSEIQPWDRRVEVGDEIRIVRSGTAEYERGKQLKDLFLEFADHQRALYNRYALEEDEILRPSNAP